MPAAFVSDKIGLFDQGLSSLRDSIEETLKRHGRPVDTGQLKARFASAFEALQERRRAAFFVVCKARLGNPRAIRGDAPANQDKIIRFSGVIDPPEHRMGNILATVVAGSLGIGPDNHHVARLGIDLYNWTQFRGLDVILSEQVTLEDQDYEAMRVVASSLVESLFVRKNLRRETVDNYRNLSNQTDLARVLVAIKNEINANIARWQAVQKSHPVGTIQATLTVLVDSEPNASLAACPNEATHAEQLRDIVETRVRARLTSYGWKSRPAVAAIGG